MLYNYGLSPVNYGLSPVQIELTILLGIQFKSKLSL